MTVQSVSSVIRQVLAVLVSVYGVLTATVPALHLSPAVSAVLTAFGPLILSIEHYVGDPSTGTPTTTAPAQVPSLPPTPGGDHSVE